MSIAVIYELESYIDMHMYLNYGDLKENSQKMSYTGP
jgi:hypothetical protein